MLNQIGDAKVWSSRFESDMVGSGFIGFDEDVGVVTGGTEW